jgi:ABC-type cobalamin/Fe3+-siderophores transport system ATPase subunit
MAGYRKPQEILTSSCISTVYGMDVCVVDNMFGKILLERFRANTFP